MFTVEQRDALRARVLAFAEQDPRIVAGAAVGSLALGCGDRFSDLDLTFAVADGVPIADVLDDWTRELDNEFAAVHLVDLERGPTTYRVFLLTELLQLDLSMSPAEQFVPAGPRFRLLFGETADGKAAPTSKPPAAADLLGWGVIYALHSRSCIERGRVWQAEHYIGAVQDHALCSHAFGVGSRRCKRVVMTTCRPPPSLSSTERTSDHWSLSGSAPLCRRLYRRSYERARGPTCRPQTRSPSGSPN